MSDSSASKYSPYHPLRTFDTIREATAQVRPHTVASNATVSDCDSSVTLFWPNATMPGPSGINVPIRPRSGAILEIVSVQARRRLQMPSARLIWFCASANSGSSGRPMLRAAVMSAAF